MNLPAIYSLGLDWDRLKLVRHNPLWPFIFREESGRILTSLSPWVIGIEHAGSSAVPWLGGKPIIDMICQVESLDNIENYFCDFMILGYRWLGECGRPGRHFFTYSRGMTTYFHLHVVELGSSFYKDLVSFRNALRADRNFAKRYYLIKKELESICFDNRKEYREKKNVRFDRFIRN